MAAQPLDQPYIASVLLNGIRSVQLDIQLPPLHPPRSQCLPRALIASAQYNWHTDPQDSRTHQCAIVPYHLLQSVHVLGDRFSILRDV